MSDAPQTMTIDEVRTLKAGEVVIVHVETIGSDEHDQEIMHPAGARGVITEVRTLPEPQGTTVTVLIGAEDDFQIVSIFDESDDCGYAFTRATDDSGFIAEPRMESAGAELMALSFRLEKHPEFADDAARLREIGAWASVERMTDMHWAFLNVLGSMMGAMGRRNFAFSEDRAISTQFVEFLDTIPEPLPGQIGYVDQATLEPLMRRDEFDASVEIGEVRHWTDGQDVEHALVHDVPVVPEGTPGRAMIHAEGGMVGLLVQGSTVGLRLKATGGALKVVGPAGLQPTVATKPTAEATRAAAVLLHTVPFDQEVAAIVAKGLDMVLADPCISRYEDRAIEEATAIRDALDAVAR